MKSHFSISIFFLLLYFSLVSPIKILVDYDEKLDLISKDGTLYFPSSSFKISTPQKNLRFSFSSFLSRHLTSSDTNLTKITKLEETETETEPEKVICEEEMVTGGTFWFYLFMVAFLTIFAGMMSGLTVGYLSVDQLTMELRERTGTPEEKEASKIILPVISNHHWLLCTLLLMNSFAMEALPVFLDRILTRLQAVIISVTLLLIFGEVIPQALCTGPRQIQIAALAAPMTRILMIISWPITYWLGKILDIVLGEHGKTRYQNKELKELVGMHTNSVLKIISEEEEKNPYIAKSEIPKPSETMGLGKFQANLMISALEIQEKTVKEIMIPFSQVFVININEPINEGKIKQIIDKGYSRIPVYSNNVRTDIVGILRIKQLMSRDLSKNKTLKELGIELKPPLVIYPDMTLIDLLMEFRKGKSHMAFITEQVDLLRAKYGTERNESIMHIDLQKAERYKDNKKIVLLGIITLEDVIKEVFNLKIIEESEYDKIKAEKRGFQRNASKIYKTLQDEKSFISDKTGKINSLISEGKKKIEMKERKVNKNEGLNENLLP